MGKRALIAMSGGVDSSVAALLMKESGYDCIGVTMKLYENEDIGIAREKTCCSLDDIEDARMVAYKIGIPYYVVNFKADFKKRVIDKFVESYLQGRTPNPCIDCNRYLKFEHLYQKAKELECDVIVTGHYSRIVQKESCYQLMRGVDETKDQSYVLYSLTQEQLAHTRFPLGELTKEQVREIAEDRGFINSSKRDSQDICFIPDGNYKRFMEETYQVKIGPGEFIDRTGKVLGHHQGYYGYTVGQRKGLGIAAATPYYVVDILPEKNQVILGNSEELFQRSLLAEEVNWIERPEREQEIQAKVRYRQKAQTARVKCLEGNRIRVDFAEPQRAITRGQAVVLYQGERVLGGGTIAAVVPEKEEAEEPESRK